MRRRIIKVNPYVLLCFLCPMLPLNEILAARPVVTSHLVGNPKEPLPFLVPLATIDVPVIGRGVDQNGEPLPGVTVSVPGSTIGTATDLDERHALCIPDGSTLGFSFIGFESQRIEVGYQSIINITLREDMTALDEVVVVGFGTQKKSDDTGSVVSENSKDFAKGVLNDALQLLVVKASGVNTSQVNAEPGGRLNIRVHGAGSINSSNEVFVVIDGLPGGSNVNINPTDKESIEIFNDAASAAVYWTRGANGVVLITTKKGKAGAPQVSYDTYFGQQTPAYKFEVLNATRYVQMINDISRDGGRNIPYTQEQIAAAGVGTDWQNQLFRNASASNHQLSISGANKDTKYYTSLGFLDQDGIMISSGFKKYNLLVNLEKNPNDRFKFGINLCGNMNMTDNIWFRFRMNEMKRWL